MVLSPCRCGRLTIDRGAAEQSLLSVAGSPTRLSLRDVAEKSLGEFRRAYPAGRKVRHVAPDAGFVLK
jgi:hypothetical protein